MLLAFHAIFARTFIFFTLVMGLWGLFTYLRKQPVSGSYRGALVIGSGVGAAQALVGLILLLVGGVPGQTIHILYGTLCAVAWPGAMGYTRGKDDNNEAFVYGLVSLVLFALALRALTTGG